MADRALRSELENYAIFEHVQSEKISPLFLRLAKGEKTNDNLASICDNNCVRFRSDSARKEYITDYYRDIYSITPGEVNAYEGCVADFLGPDIVNNREILNKKVPVELRNDFESDLSEAELDMALEKMRNASAGGPDGMSVKFLKKIWCFFRIPLKKYVICCVNKGVLTHSFSTASIKLIPKKGDITKIKNWRPISLLNVLYKVAAKAINNRLKRAAPLHYI
jgi:hypothetical protein